MVMESSHVIAILLALCLSQTTRAAISPLDKTYTTSVGNDLTIPWSFDNEADMSTVFWSHKTTTTPTTVMSKTGLNAAVIFNSFNIQHVSNGEVKLTSIEMDNAGIYYCEVSYSLASGLPSVTGTATVSIEGCKCECDCVCRTIVIVSMVFGILGALGLLIIVGGIPAGCLNERETLLLTSGVIGIVFDVLSLVLSIVVKVKECCKCCEENCEDSECCKDWIDKAATAFIVIPCVAIVVSVVIFILVKLELIRPGNDAYKAKEAKHPDENHGMTGTSM